MSIWEYDISLTEADFSKMLDEATDKDNLIEGLKEWSPFTVDALNVARDDHFDFVLFKVGLVKERAGEFTGEEWVKSYGKIMLPSRMMRASLLASEFQAPLSIAMQRMVELGKLDE